jgi:hypothetical protein
MTKQQMTELVGLIVERVYGDTGKVSLGSTSGCGPVTLQIGFINNIVQHDGIVITDAPSAITEVVMDWIAKQKAEDQHSLVRASAGYGGLFIR